MFNPDNDADFETMDFEEAARLEFYLKKKGICTHGWLQNGLCNNCGKQFPSNEAAEAERNEILNEYR